MKVVDLKKFERKLRIRSLTKADFDQLVALQLQCFPGMLPWSRAQIESQLDVFPEGQLIVEYDGKLVASSSCLIVDFELYTEWANWKVIADNGYIKNHDPEGDTLYGIEIMVAPEFRGMKLARRLYDERKRICREYNLQRMIIGGRIPGYGAHADQLSAQEYVEKVRGKSLFDQVLTAQLANGFVLRRLIPNYMPSDVESRGYATFLEWTNIDYLADEKPERPRSVRICAVQYQIRKVKDFKEFGRQCEFFVDVASDYKADFVVFPEVLTTQLLPLVKARRPAAAVRKLAEFTDAYLELFRKLSIRYNVNIVGGSQFTLEGDDLYNVAYLFRRDGTVGRQAKLHIAPGERHWWGVKPGPAVEVLDTDRGKVAIVIGYDIEFPEVARIAVAQGAQILFVPFNTDERHGYLRARYCALARCTENHVYAVLSGCVGNLPFVENADVHYGVSGMYTPCDFAFSRDGVAAEGTPNIETVVIHDLNLELLREHRHRGTVRNWNDRRGDLYSVRYRDGAVHRDV